MAKIQLNWDGRCSPLCPVCGWYGGTASYDTDLMHYQCVYGLCLTCTADKHVRSAVDAVENLYRQAERLPSWWACLWLPEIHRSAIRCVIALRADAQATSKATNTRRRFWRDGA